MLYNKNIKLSFDIYSSVQKFPKNITFTLDKKCLGVFERKKCHVNISKMGKYEVCIPKSRILV